MSLPDSYLIASGRVPAYFDAILGAEPPERFSYKFLKNLDFTSSNDRLLIKVLKELGFLDTDGVPQERYYRYLDRSISEKILAEGVYEAFDDLFAVNKNAHELETEEVQNKLRTLYTGEKSDRTIKRIAKTFTALCDIADFSTLRDGQAYQVSEESTKSSSTQSEINPDTAAEEQPRNAEPPPRRERPHASTNGAALKSDFSANSLQYHINIVLPESRDQAVYDAIFKAMKKHLE